MAAKILICYGTRPELLKILPLQKMIDAQKIPYSVFFTGQHEDLRKKGIFDFSLGIIDLTNRLNDCFVQISDWLTRFLAKHPEIEYVLVQGDTVSAYACALAAFNCQVKVIHLEAGLRTWNMSNPWPEESYRQAITGMSSINLCPTQQNLNNIAEYRGTSECYVVGNTVIDSLKKYGTEIKYNNQVLVTLHRRENLPIMDQWFSEIEKLAVSRPDIEFILPIHPNPNVRKHRDLLKTVKVIEPLYHEDLINVLKNCALVCSDSGGLQEEASFFKKKVIVCRETTERPESLGLTSFLCSNPSELSNLFKLHIESPIPVEHECCFGDGDSSQRIVNILKDRLL